MFRTAFAALILIPTAFAQNANVPTFRWVTEADASGKDSFAGMGVDGVGNNYLVGSNYQPTQTTRDVYVIKLDTSGNVVYTTHVGGSDNDDAVAMAVDGAGNVYVTGTTTSHDFPKITVYATGVGPVSFTDGYAVTHYPVNVFLDGFYCNGVAAIMGPAAGLPGSVYQITVIVPDPASFASFDPGYTNFVYPSPSSAVIQVNGVSSPAGLTISISSAQ